MSIVDGSSDYSAVVRQDTRRLPLLKENSMFKVFHDDMVINAARILFLILPYIVLLILAVIITALIVRHRTLKDREWLNQKTVEIITDLELQVAQWKLKAREERKTTNGVLKELYTIILAKMDNKEPRV